MNKKQQNLLTQFLDKALVMMIGVIVGCYGGQTALIVYTIMYLAGLMVVNCFTYLYLRDLD